MVHTDEADLHAKLDHVGELRSCLLIVARAWWDLSQAENQHNMMTILQGLAQCRVQHRAKHGPEAALHIVLRLILKDLPHPKMRVVNAAVLVRPRRACRDTR